MNSAVSALVGLICLGCVGESAAPPVVMAPPPVRNEHWADAVAARSWPLARDAFVSRGHGVRTFLAEVRVAPPNLEAYRRLAPGQLMPVGAVVAAFHRSRETGAPSSIYVMTKRAPDDWQFLVSEPDGTRDENWNLELCARCHAEAAADHLFGLPMSPDPPALPAR